MNKQKNKIRNAKTFSLLAATLSPLLSCTGFSPSSLPNSPIYYEGDVRHGINNKIYPEIKGLCKANSYVVVRSTARNNALSPVDIEVNDSDNSIILLDNENPFYPCDEFELLVELRDKNGLTTDSKRIPFHYCPGYSTIELQRIFENTTNNIQNQIGNLQNTTNNIQNMVGNLEERVTEIEEITQNPPNNPPNNNQPQPNQQTPIEELLSRGRVSFTDAQGIPFPRIGGTGPYNLGSAKKVYARFSLPTELVTRIQTPTPSGFQVFERGYTGQGDCFTVSAGNVSRLGVQGDSTIYQAEISLNRVSGCPQTNEQIEVNFKINPFGVGDVIYAQSALATQTD